jgi:hypothetical protein
MLPISVNTAHCHTVKPHKNTRWTTFKPQICNILLTLLNYDKYLRSNIVIIWHSHFTDRRHKVNWYQNVPRTEAGISCILSI